MRLKRHKPPLIHCYRCGRYRRWDQVRWIWPQSNSTRWEVACHDHARLENAE